MTGPATSRNDPHLQTSLPGGAVALDSVLCTEELERRPSLPPDYEKENCALVALVKALADSPSTIFQALVETIPDITQCDTAALACCREMAWRSTFTAKGFIGWLSLACGSRTPEVELRAISARRRPGEAKEI